MAIMANPIELEHFLEQAPFPCGREELLDYARKHNAKASILVSLEKLPERSFQDAGDAAGCAWQSDEQEQGVAGGADSPDDL